jgi:hypothetical protein
MQGVLITALAAAACMRRRSFVMAKLHFGKGMGAANSTDIFSQKELHRGSNKERR